MQVTILEKIFNQDSQYKKQREKLYIQKFNTRYKGLNRINGGWRTLLIASFFKNSFSIWYNNFYIWQCALVLNQSDVDLIKRSKYITDRIPGYIFLKWESLTYHKKILTDGGTIELLSMCCTKQNVPLNICHKRS